MLLFHEFKSLPRRFQSLATQFWANEIMHLAKVDNVNQLPNEIELLAGIEGYALKKRRQKYWYKKIKGEPIGNTNELDLIEKIFDNSSNVLLSPIWQLLATKDQPLNDLIILSKRLPSKQRDLLFNSEGKPDVSKFSMAECGIYNDLDSIMLIFIVHLLSKSIVPHYDEVKNEQFMIRKIIFLYNSRYNTYKYRFKSTLQLCQYFSVFFSSELSNTQNKSITFINVEEQKFEILNSIPQKLSQLSSKDII
jgi:hypothetical protein